MIPAVLFALLLAADQANKIWVRAHVPQGQVTPLVPGLFDLTYAPNRGVAFSTFAELPPAVRVPLLLVVPSLVTVGVAVYALRTWRVQPALMRAAFVLVLSGAVGNLIDRVCFGEVTDFVRFRLGERVLFVNNLADDFISIGAVLLGLAILGQRRAPAAATPAARLSG